MPRWLCVLYVRRLRPGLALWLSQVVKLIRAPKDNGELVLTVKAQGEIIYAHVRLFPVFVFFL